MHSDFGESGGNSGFANDSGSDESDVLHTGVVRTWLNDRRFGFIEPDRGGSDLFFHESSIADDDGGLLDHLNYADFKGTRVQFVVEHDHTRSKNKAVSVSRVPGSYDSDSGEEYPSDGSSDGNGSCYESDVLHTGVVRTWLNDRRFGFIEPDRGGSDLFFHESSIADDYGDLLDSLDFAELEGTRVQFVVEYDRTKQKNRAASVCCYHGY